MFGLTNIFSLGLGSYISDRCNRSMSLRGRLLAQMTCKLLEGISILIFGRCNTLRSTIFTVVFFPLSLRYVCDDYLGDRTKASFRLLRSHIYMSYLIYR